MKSQPHSFDASAGPDGAGAGPSGDPVPLHLTFKSDPQHLGPTRIAVEKLCAAAGFERGACEEVGLVLNEAVANVIRHAYGNRHDQPIELHARTGPSGLELQLRDWGPGKVPMPAKRDEGAGRRETAAPSTAPSATPSAAPSATTGGPAGAAVKVEDLKPGGLGLVCMKSLMDEVVFEPQSDGMLLIMRRRRRTATPRGTAGGK
jgi:anti-sigma regulatory factor (Ser/Thr protein kinase)